MSKKREVFPVRRAWRSPVEKMTDHAAGKLFKAIFAYADGEDPKLDSEIWSAWTFIEPEMTSEREAQEAKSRKNTENGSKGGRPKKQRTNNDELFARFWEAYPRKAAKAAARKAFTKISEKTLTEEILPDIEKRKNTDQWKKDRGAYIPYPATYLNGKRWNDEMPKPVKAYAQREVTDEQFKDLFLPL